MNGWSRRNFIKVGLSGLTLPQFLAMRSHAMPSNSKSAATGFGSAKSCIVLFAWGGLSQLVTFDMKRDAPKEVRGSFRSIPTNDTDFFSRSAAAAFLRLAASAAAISFRTSAY